MDKDLTESERAMSVLLDEMFQAAIEGDYRIVRKNAKKIHAIAKHDKMDLIN